MCFKHKHLKNIISVIILISCIVVSCKSEKKRDKQDFKIIIDTLSTQESKEQFLLKVFKRDQRVRNPNVEKEILEQTHYDMQSPEYKNHMSQMHYVDSLNFCAVYYYLKKHGYPDFRFNNALAEYAIIAVARHQNPRNRMKLLPHLQKAYKEGNLKAEDFSDFLEEIHIDRFGKGLKINNPTTYKENIGVLIEKLGIK